MCFDSPSSCSSPPCPIFFLTYFFMGRVSSPTSTLLSVLQSFCFFFLQLLSFFFVPLCPRFFRSLLLPLFSSQFNTSPSPFSLAFSCFLFSFLLLFLVCLRLTFFLPSTRLSFVVQDTHFNFHRVFFLLAPPSASIIPCFLFSPSRPPVIDLAIPLSAPHPHTVFFYYMFTLSYASALTCFHFSPSRPPIIHLPMSPSLPPICCLFD